MFEKMFGTRLKEMRTPLSAILPFGKRISIRLIRHDASKIASRPSVNEITHENTSSFRHINDLPGPGFFSNWIHLKNGFDQSFQTEFEFSKKYGSIFVQELYGKKFVVISDPKFAETVYRAEAKWPYREFDILKEMILKRQKMGLPKGLVETQGEEWAKLRKILGNQMLPPLKMKKYYEDFSDVACDAVNLIASSKDSADVIEDLETLISKWSVESIGMFVFGQRTGLLSEHPSEKAESFVNALDGFLVNTMKYSTMPWMKYIFRSHYKQFLTDLQFVHNIGFELIGEIVKNIKNALESGNAIDDNLRKSFVYYLMSEDSMSERECIVHAVDAYSAGKDTTSVTLSWLWYHLGTNPEKQEKLASEINAFANSDTAVNAALFQKMPYLRACIKESARLTPAAASLLRILEKDLVLGDLYLPKFTKILISNYIMGKNEELFPDAEKFKPERWLRDSNNEIEINSFASQPFGYGSRSCVGKRISEAEMQVFTYNTLKRFRLEYVGKPQEGKMMPLFTPTEPLRFAFHER